LLKTKTNYIITKDLTKLDLNRIIKSGRFSRPCVYEFRDDNIILTIGDLLSDWQVQHKINSIGLKFIWAVEDKLSEVNPDEENVGKELWDHSTYTEQEWILTFKFR
jgi:hypothetical protein